MSRICKQSSRFRENLEILSDCKHRCWFIFYLYLNDNIKLLLLLRSIRWGNNTRSTIFTQPNAPIDSSYNSLIKHKNPLTVQQINNSLSPAHMFQVEGFWKWNICANQFDFFSFLKYGIKEKQGFIQPYNE